MDLLLSAHADDVAYSIGGLLLKGYCHEPKLVTVFQKSIYAPYSVESGSSEAVICNIRYAEDIAYANKLGLQHEGIGLKDVTLRGYTNLDTIFTVTDYRQDPDAEASIQAIQSFLNTQTGVTRLWVPLGIGKHIDHIILQKAVLLWSATSSLEKIFYEDVPYTGFEELSTIETWVQQTLGAAELEMIDICQHLEEKLQNLQLYSSQVSSEDLERVKFHAQRIVAGTAVERIWRQKT
ncbi:MAG: hypothetical protein F6K55_07980 [Moorea sp. SIO4A3]|nr:hypothetical protein [Moorena sp. SIO4A3]